VRPVSDNVLWRSSVEQKCKRILPTCLPAASWALTNSCAELMWRHIPGIKTHYHDLMTWAIPSGMWLAQMQASLAHCASEVAPCRTAAVGAHW